MCTRTVVIPIDASKHSENAFDWYVSNMYKENEDSLILLHCIEMKPPSELVVIGDDKEKEEKFKEWVESHDANKRKLDEKYTEKTKDLKFSSYKFEFKTHDHQSVGHAICCELEHVKADLVVVGSRGLGTIRRTFLGSVSDYVLHHSHAPVIIIPAQSHHHH